MRPDQRQLSPVRKSLGSFPEDGAVPELDGASFAGSEEGAAEQQELPVPLTAAVEAELRERIATLHNDIPLEERARLALWIYSQAVSDKRPPPEQTEEMYQILIRLGRREPDDMVLHEVLRYLLESYSPPPEALELYLFLTRWLQANKPVVRLTADQSRVLGKRDVTDEQLEGLVTPTRAFTVALGKPLGLGKDRIKGANVHVWHSSFQPMTAVRGRWVVTTEHRKHRHIQCSAQDARMLYRDYGELSGNTIRVSPGSEYSIGPADIVAVAKITKIVLHVCDGYRHGKVYFVPPLAGDDLPAPMLPQTDDTRKERNARKRRRMKR